MQWNIASSWKNQWYNVFKAIILKYCIAMTDFTSAKFESLFQMDVQEVFFNLFQYGPSDIVKIKWH